MCPLGIWVLVPSVEDAKREWHAHGTQIRRIKVDVEKNCQETLATTNNIKEAVLKNNSIFTEKWEMTHKQIDHWLEDILLLKNHLVNLEGRSGLQQTIFSNFLTDATNSHWE